MKICNFGKTKKFRLDVTISKKQEKSEKSHFSAYRKWLAEKHVLFWIKTVEDMKFGKNQKVLSWCDDFKKTRKIQKSHFFGLRKIISRKIRFFLNQNRWRYDAFSGFLESTLCLLSCRSLRTRSTGYNIFFIADAQRLIL